MYHFAELALEMYSRDFVTWSRHPTILITFSTEKWFTHCFDNLKGVDRTFSRSWADVSCSVHTRIPGSSIFDLVSDSNVVNIRLLDIHGYLNSGDLLVV